MSSFRDLRTSADGEDDYKFPAKAPANKWHRRSTDGVCFNVQDVPDLGHKLPTLSPAGVSTHLSRIAGRFYRGRCMETSAAIEAHSVTDSDVVDSSDTSLAHIALLAFARHYPLSLKPDDIWLTLMQGMSHHIEQNAEALRSRFVNYSGKKTITYRNDSVTLGAVPRQVWESEVLPFFSRSVREEIGERCHGLMVPQFSTTGKTDRAAMEVSLLSAMKSYFTFHMMTLCGIPWIELQGSVADWKDLRSKVDELEGYVTPDLAKRWLPPLKEVLDEFVGAYEGNVNHLMWQRMVKKVHRHGSGQSTFLSGWINVFYPYLADGELNRGLRAWKDVDTFCGPEPKELSGSVSSVPVKWSYLGKDYPMHFHAGHVGMKQDDSLALRPLIGWVVSHDPSTESKK